MMGESPEAMLSVEAARVLGSLMEKQMTTPDYYPLTLKALTAACNQKSSRVPVMKLSESEVGGVVQTLRGEGLITARMDGRADRFEQHLSRKLALTHKERAILCVLMLRGALTLNEIRINTGRMVSFDSADEVQELLDQMMTRDLLLRIPRAAGQRGDRFAQLLCGKPDTEAVAPCTADTRPSGNHDSARIDQLEAELAALKASVQQLWERLPPV